MNWKVELFDIAVIVAVFESWSEAETVEATWTLTVKVASAPTARSVDRVHSTAPLTSEQPAVEAIDTFLAALPGEIAAAHARAMVLVMRIPFDHSG